MSGGEGGREGQGRERLAVTVVALGMHDCLVLPLYHLVLCGVVFVSSYVVLCGLVLHVRAPVPRDHPLRPHRFRVQGSGFRVQGSGFRVSDFGFSV